MVPLSFRPTGEILYRSLIRFLPLVEMTEKKLVEMTEKKLVEMTEKKLVEMTEKKLSKLINKEIMECESSAKT